jgi:uncharacterized protein (TIGR02145 family)
MKNIIRISGVILLFILIQSCKKEVDDVIKDIDGNVYTSVTIGTQSWMVENLKVTSYNDGSQILNIINNSEWVNSTTGAYCWYNNDATINKDIYGALYNWYAVNTGKLCPSGWHVPSADEWDNLIIYLGGESGAGGKLKETGITHWLSPNTGATNETGFTALPSGHRNNFGDYSYLGSVGIWWSPNDYNSNSIYAYQMPYNSSALVKYLDWKYMGFSVRCLRN